MQTNIQRLIAGALLLAVGAGIRAAPIAYDGFESYTAGNNLDGGSGGTGWTSNWTGSEVTSGDAAVIAKSMTYNGGDISVNGGSNALRLRNINQDIALRSYTSQTGTVYLSYLFETPTSANTGTNTEFFQQWNRPDEIYSNTDQASVLHRRDSSVNQTRFGARINGTTQDFGTSPNTQNNTTYFVVARISKSGMGTAGNYRTIDVAVNPTSLTEPVTWTASQTSTDDFSSLSSLGFRLDFVETGDEYYIDEIRVGDTWEAVVVPEPSTLVLTLVSGLAGLLLLRRRR